MAKELVNHQVMPGVFANVKIEDGKLKIAAEADLGALVDKAGEAIPGDSAMEQLVKELIKQAFKAI